MLTIALYAKLYRNFPRVDEDFRVCMLSVIEPYMFGPWCFTNEGSYLIHAGVSLKMKSISEISASCSLDSIISKLKET